MSAIDCDMRVDLQNHRFVLRDFNIDHDRPFFLVFIKFLQAILVTSQVAISITSSLIVYILKCASTVAVLVRRRHHLVIFFIVVVVGHLELREMSTSRFGLSSSIYAICDDCGLTEFLGTGEHNSLDNGPRTVQGKDVNRRVVYAASEMGIGTLSSRLYTQKCK